MNESSETTQTRDSKHTNRLVSETSPYLLQHAHNPVDWYPWGEEAFKRAKDENKPIFLSIGYSACHWCHVMEKESFENEEVAEILNRHFISIKVDREERPDIDEIYMTSVVMIAGSGGWPLSVFLTADLKPFFGGTYFPPEDMYGRPGFKNLLLQISKVWNEQHDEILASADGLTAEIRRTYESPSGPHISDIAALPRATSNAVEQMIASFDKTWGGFGTAPKFPPSGALSLLLRQYTKTGDKSLLKPVVKTLDRMAYGGIYDQIAGGFHRYTVDRQWLTPHFEKMLYDNALLSSVYLEGYQVTGTPLYRRIAEETLDHVIRDMSDKDGGFHSTLDADSEGVEGKYYVWSREDIITLLGEEEGDLFCEHYGVTARGNFEGENILHVPKSPETFALSQKITSDELAARLKASADKLMNARNKRIPPSKDDKVISSWNGMMISSFAQGYQVLGHKRHLIAAEKAGEFILSKMIEGNELFRTYRHGTRKIPAYLDDYANVANAFMDLYETTFDIKWLKASDLLTKKMIELFWDSEDHGFYATSLRHKNLITRTKPFSDSSVPSGNAVAALLLCRLSVVTGSSDYATKSEQLFTTAIPRIQRESMGYLRMLLAGDFKMSPSSEIVIVGHKDSANTTSMLDAVRKRHLPNKVILLLDPSNKDASVLRELSPLASDRAMINDRATAYVCEDYSCKKPVTDIEELSRLLDTL